MSLIERRFTTKPDDLENTRPVSRNTKKTWSQTFSSGLSCSSEIRKCFQIKESSQMSYLLKSLRKREVLVQSDNLREARVIKEMMSDPEKLKREYSELMERYKGVKGRISMRPRKIPRSGIDINNEGKRIGYLVITNEE